MKPNRQIILAGLAGATLLSAALAIGHSLQYQRDLAAARTRIAAGSTRIDTPCGPIEYAESGDGVPVMIIHGAGGGFDQGLLLGQFLLGPGFRLIAPSRFGYLNAGLPADTSLTAQARAYVCLLDALQLDRVHVIGFSAGGPSALLFARDHPDRVDRLVMVSAISFSAPDGDPGAPANARAAAINALIATDPVYWLGMRYGRGPMLDIFGVPAAARRTLTPAQQADLDTILAAMLPMTARLDGIALDQTRVLPWDSGLETITAPTLVVHAFDDTLIPLFHGVHTAGRIPNAHLFTVDTGGHFLAGRFDQVRPVVTDFITTPATATNP